MSVDIDTEFLALTLPDVKVYLPRAVTDRRSRIDNPDRAPYQGPERRDEIRRISDRQYDEWKESLK